jgi:hypothetical protein
VALDAAPAAIPKLPASAMYVHPVSREVNGRSLLYLDYWWYLPDNPARAGSGAFCGAGLVIPGISCFNHQSDWEGVTVVVDRTERGGRRVHPEPRWVHYAEHAGVVSYVWGELRAHWRAAPFERYVAGIGDAAERPLVFVSSGTHASYPTPCPGPLRREPCRQIANKAEEGDADGELPWLGNVASRCGPGLSCLGLLPTLAGGTAAALWNAFEGPWGRRHCVLKYYCDSSDPPKAPGKQGRYGLPARYHARVPLEPSSTKLEPKRGTGFDE